MSEPAARRSLVKYLYNHNPFYAISVALMLISIRAAYGTLEIGAINCFLMMGVLAGYTLLLAVIGVLIVRWGKVWEDARSIVLLVLLLFLGVSISADDLIMHRTTPEAASALLLCGYAFSALLSEAVLWGTGIRLALRYRVPFHLMIALFFAAPWWCAPDLHPRSADSLEWTLFSFPAAGSLLLLCLLPAVRSGPSFVAENGTPWRWPLFPWTAFGVIVAAVCLRSFSLCLAFGPTGPVWRRVGRDYAIVFDTIWGPYFLVPLALAVLLLLLEGGLATGNRQFLRRVITTAPALLLLAYPFSGGRIFREFLATVTETLGSPLWLTTLLLIAFYVYGWLRRAPGAGSATVATCALLSVVHRRTVDLHSLGEPQSWPFLAIGGVLLVRGLWRRSSRLTAAAAASTTFGLWLWLAETAWADSRTAVCAHLLWAAVLIVGIVYRDSFAHFLRAAAAMFIPLASLAAATGAQAGDVLLIWRVLYIAFLAALGLLLGKLTRSYWFYYSFAGTVGGLLYGILVFGFRRAVAVLGFLPVSAFVWSLGALLLAVLISAHKANWLPRQLLPRRRTGKKDDPPLSPAGPDTIDGFSPAE